MDTLQKFYEMTGLYLKALKNQEVIYESDGPHFPDTYEEPGRQLLLSADEPLCFTVTGEALFYGLIQLKNITVFVGPAFSENDDPHQRKNLADRTGIPEDLLNRRLRKIPRCNSSLFANHITFLCSCLNNNQLLFPMPVTDTDRSQSLTENVVPAMRNQIPQHIEAAFVNCIKDGDLDALETMFAIIAKSRFFPEYQTNVIRTTKNIAIISTAIASRAAVEAGADYLTAVNASNLFIDRIEMTADYSELQQLIYDILRYYTGLAADARPLPGETALVCRVRRYIHIHAADDLSVAKLAEEMGVNPDYLSHHYREITGRTLTSDIREEKISEAKRLLTQTDLPLAEIALHLSFSSQQYFQTVFKRVAGVTPTEFRDGLCSILK